MCSISLYNKGRLKPWLGHEVQGQWFWDVPDALRGVLEMGMTLKISPLDVSRISDMDREDNHAAARRLWPEAQGFFYGQQVHGVEVREALSGGSPFNRFEQTDGLWTSSAGAQLMVFTADCLPVFLVAGDGKASIALLHAGWRGLKSGIVEAGLTAMGLTHESIRQTRAFLGPCIRPCCYEVGEEFNAYFTDSLTRDTSKCLRMDLAREAAVRLQAQGIREDMIFDSGECTGCGQDKFFSYRRDKEKAGRMVSWIMKKQGRRHA